MRTIKDARKMVEAGYTRRHAAEVCGVTADEIREEMGRALRPNRELLLLLAAYRALEDGVNPRVVWGNFADVLPEDFLT